MGKNQQFKCVVSQTIYASLHVGFQGDVTGDTDTNGFPKIRRDETAKCPDRPSAAPITRSTAPRW